MGTYTADQFIGKTLVAQNNVTAFFDYPGSNNIFVIYKGQNIGVVYSWVIKNTPDHKLWWEFMDDTGRPYFVPGDPNYVGMTTYDKETMQTVEDKAAQYNAEQAQKQEGEFAYYAKKWGEKILYTGAGIYVGLQILKTIIHERNNRNSRAKS